jgi:alpha-tubulin suppressor-like RCC1 family protein
VAAGKQHTLLLTIDGKVYSMGKNKDGCLGKTLHSLFEAYCTPAHG